ncbi:gag-asp_proteas domain-containing protein [Cephalotus follicularis]|uniref:Gag-asp_proteas domain-containing protein n=1 Tax=Cephalotus follicularis TaxID=3775 RepID=A0A1Q3DGS3_CEPFO|nr:gag-asp_proteas domain-containing protein [Cephalotus follicularis]
MKVNDGSPSGDKAKPKDKRDVVTKKDDDHAGKGKAKATDGLKEKKSSGKCFICDGPHRARDCPKREKLNAFVAQDDSGADSDSDVSARVAPIQLVSALRAIPPSDLMYVRLMIKGQQVAATTDTGATHSFLEERIVHRLDLKVDMHTSRIKKMNSQAQAVTGMAHSVKILLDDFDLILGSEIFISEKVIIMPYLCGLLVTNEQNPCFVAGYNDATGGKRRAEMLPAMQVARGLKKGRLTYLASLVGMESECDVFEKQIMEYLNTPSTRTSSSSGGGGLLAP